MKIEVFVTTAKRSKWCLNLLNDLKEQGKGLDYDIRVFHDNCDTDYSGVVTFCNDNKNFHYYKTNKNFGRNGFWFLNNLMYQFLETLQYDYFIQMPDDIVLVDGFFKRAIKLIENDIDICNFFTPNVYVTTNLMNERHTVNGAEMWHNNWIDCCFIARQNVMKGFQLEAVNPNRWSHRKHTGSGVGSGFVEVYNKRENKHLYQTVYSLCEHIGAFSSAMHEKIRAEKYYHLKYSDKISYKKNTPNPLLMSLLDSDKQYIETKINKLLKSGKI